MAVTMKDARKARGLSQDKMAYLMGVSRATYNKYENDTGAITVAKLAQFCKLTGVHITEILLPFDFANVK